MGGEVTIEGVDDVKDMEDTRRTFTLLGKNDRVHLLGRPIPFDFP